MNKQAYVEGYYTCPYDESHRILRARFAVHLVKCGKNYPNSPVAVCAFNSTHIVPEPELKYHMDNCPDREQTERFVTTLSDSQPIVEINFQPTCREDEENWETNTPSYNPEEYCANNPILRRLDIASKAKRREWHVAERRRFQEFEAAQEPPKAMKGPRAPRAAPPPINRPREELPEAITRMKQMTIASDLSQLQDIAAAQPPPLSEILNTARGPGERSAEDRWEKVPVRGRGRGRKPQQ